MNHKGILSLLQAIFFATAGIVVAGLLTSQHYDVAMAEKMCGLEGGCAKVLASRYSTIAGVPNSVIGIAFYAFLLLGLLVGMMVGPNRVRKGILLACDGVALGGAAISVALMVIQFIILRAFCPLCTLSALLMFMLLVSIHDARIRTPWPPMPLRATLLAGCVGVLLIFGYVALHIGRATGSRPEILARIDRRILTTRDLEREASAAIEVTNQSLYEARRDWLDRKITQIVIDAEAARRKLDPGQLVKQEVDEKLKDAEAALDAWLAPRRDQSDFDPYAARRRAMEELWRQRFTSWVDSLKTRHDIEILLQRPRGRLGDLDPTLTHTLAPPEPTIPTIRFVLFSDFQCPYCAELMRSLEALRARFSFEVSITYVHFPMPTHEKALPAATASEAAAEQGKFWLYHDLLMKHNGDPPADWESHARELNLDLPRFRAALQSPAVKERIERSIKQSKDLGISAVPTLFLNGRRIGGLLSLEELTQLVQMERRSHSFSRP